MLAGLGCEPGITRWLDEGRALDIPFTARFEEARTALKGGHEGMDVAIQVEATRAKRLLVADMDSTMIEVECIDELADFAGLKPQIAEITERAMQGELDFAAALTERVALLKGLPESAIAECLEQRVTLTPGATTLIATMRARGAICLLVSGGFTHFTQPVAERLGFNRTVANTLDIADGKLSGAVIPPIVDSQTKKDTLLAAMAELGLDAAETLAVGDGANDIPMIEAAGTGYAYHAKEKARTAADVAIRHNDLTALLYAQGLAIKDWITT